LQAPRNGAAIAQKLGFIRLAINRESGCGNAETAALAVDDKAHAAQVRSQQSSYAAGAALYMSGPDTQSPL
jgi:hypothetical protein